MLHSRLPYLIQHFGCAGVPTLHSQWNCLRIVCLAALMTCCVLWSAVRAADEALTPRLLSHLKQSSPAVGEKKPPSGRRAATPRSLASVEDVFGDGPPASIDGPESLPPPTEIEEFSPFPDEVAPDELSPFVSDGPIAAEHPLLSDPELRDGMVRLSNHRNGFFQKLSVAGTWLAPGSDPNDLGMVEFESFASFALPFPITAWPLVFSPGYNMHLMDGPQVTDLPARLHDAYVDFMWLPTFVNRYTLLLGVTPGYYSDFMANDGDAFRITGKGLVIYDLDPDRLQLVLGVAYLGRDNLKVLPIGGAIWSPTDYLRLELIFPKPKIAARFNVGYGYEDWLYSTAEYGGNTYAIERPGGVHDKVTLQDFRLLLGVERKLNGGTGYRAEVGYVFGRRATYLSGRGDFEPHDTILLRAGITF